MYLEIGIQSVSDIITNSSSEIFSVYSDLSKEELLDLLRKVNSKYCYKGSYEDWLKLSKEEQSKYDQCSGMGGELEVQTFDDIYQKDLKYIPDNKKPFYTKEIYSLHYEEPLEELEKRLTINIDDGFTHTINWILENLYVVGCNYDDCVKDENGRVIKLFEEPTYSEIFLMEKEEASTYWCIGDCLIIPDKEWIKTHTEYSDLFEKYLTETKLDIQTLVGLFIVKIADSEDDKVFNQAREDCIVYVSSNSVD